MAYTEAEIRAFKLKDLMNCRMSALKAAATNNEGKGVTIDALRTEADCYFEWLRQDQDKEIDAQVFETSNSDSKVTYPTNESSADAELTKPTLQQKKILDVIYEKVCPNGRTYSEQHIYKNVLDWAEKEKGVRAYPNKKESIQEFLRWFNK